MPEPREQMGLNERGFQARSQLAEEQHREITGERARFGRLLKQFGRADFKQQKQGEVAQVRHIATIPQRPPRGGRTLGLRGKAGRERIVGGAQGAGGAPKAGQKKSQQQGTIEIEGPTSSELAEAKRRTTMTGGGMAQIDRAKRWTTSGYRSVGAEESSYYTAPTVVAGAKITSYRGDTGSMVARKKRQFGDAYQRQRRKLEGHYLAKGQKGAEAVETLMKEYERRQVGLFGALKLFGKFKV